MLDPHTSRLKPGELKLIRTVDQLHPTVEVALSPADIDYYRRLGPYALVLDRQSHKKELTREEATGQTNRVRNVLTMARDLGFALPAPQENTDRQEGQFQFAFGAGECRYHWFVDGLTANASGYTASPWARLQLWRAAKAARILRRHGCPPAGILIGELTRFFRSQKQFMDWYYILKDSGARVHIYGCPELTPESEETLLPMLLSQTGALSLWLGRQNRMACETRRLAGQLFKRRAPFGLQFNLDKTSKGFLREVYPHPVEWPLLQQITAGLSAGRFPTRPAAMEWLVTEALAAGVPEQRIPRSRSWLTDLLKGELLSGVYYQYAEHYTPCKIEQEEGDMGSDWDYTSNGNRRYLRAADLERALRFDVLLLPEDEIPPDQLAGARAQVSRHGRPRTTAAQRAADHASAAASLLRDGVMHCAVCGAVVFERAPRLTGTETNRWTRAADFQLVEILHRGFSNAEIAEQLGIKTHRVDQRRSRMQYQGLDLALDLARLQRHWEDPFARRMGSWHLYCTCVGETAVQEVRSATEVRTWSVAQHARKRNGSVTLALEPLLWKALLNDTQIDLSAVPTPTGANVATLEAEAARLTHRIQRVQHAYEEEDWTLYTPDEARVRLAAFRGDLASVQGKIAAACGSRLDTNDHQDLIAWEQTRQQLCEMLQSPRFQESHADRRRVMELCITRVEINLDTGTWEADTRLHAESLRKLCGAALTEATADVIRNTSLGVGCLYDKRFILRGHVRLAA